MDTADKNPEISSPEITPPAAASPLQTSMIIDAENALAAPGSLEEKQQQPEKTPTPLQDSLRRLRRDKRAMASVVVILLFVILPIIGPPIYQHIGGIYNSPTSGSIGPAVYHSPFHTELTRQDEGPSAQYWLGTDAIGRDLLARLLQGMLISLIVAVSVEIVNVVLGIGIGVLAGFLVAGSISC
jgi:peptide/nickel transport system permease protein